MAKKISKHSRAARRGLVSESGESKDLEKLPAMDSGVKKSIARTTINNEHLLQKKMENSRIKKTKKKTSALQSKIERNDKLGGVLATKIQQSIERAKYIQSSRKAGWDQINKSLASTKEKIDEEKPEAMDEDDEYVREFYEGVKERNYKDGNKFALLGEEDA